MLCDVLPYAREDALHLPREGMGLSDCKKRAIWPNLSTPGRVLVASPGPDGDGVLVRGIGRLSERVAGGGGARWRPQTAAEANPCYRVLKAYFRSLGGLLREPVWVQLF